ncbi:TPA: ERF family protein [Streptococcus suis]|nr:ERF family protein [Streptococcus suis]
MTKMLRKKLLNIQKDLKAPKGQYNSFGKYSYRNAEDIMEALKPLLVDNNTVCYCKDDYVEQIGERYYLVATIVFADVESDEEITVRARAREEENKKGMDGSQITGSASSYARKYALSGLFLIDDNKDADSDEYHKQNNQPKQKQQPKQAQQATSDGLINQEQYTELVGWVRNLAQTINSTYDDVEAQLLKHYQIQDFHQVPANFFDNVIGLVKAKIEKNKQNNFNNL